MSFAHPRHAALWALVEPRLPPGELAHDRFHILRVHAWALRLAPEAGADPDLAGAAALVHDLVFVPKDSAQRSQGGELSAAAAPVVLAEAGYAASEIALIADAVRTSSWSRGLPPAGPLGAVLQDADRLDAIGALGLMRNLACAQHMASAQGLHPYGLAGLPPGLRQASLPSPGDGSVAASATPSICRHQPLAAAPSGDGAPRQCGFYHPEDPLAASGRPLDDKTWAADHLPAKLLKLAAGMHTATARAEAQRRHAFLHAWLAELGRELA